MSLRKLLLSITFALGLVWFGNTSSHAVVFGVEMTDASEKAPWVAAIWYAEKASDEPEFICSGSLITKDVVITAAHCAFDKGFYWVRLKSDTLKSDEPLREVSAVWRHERYNKKTTQNDLGLLKLTEPVSGISPIPLPKKEEISKVNASSKFQILGWGIDQSKAIAKFLRYANLVDQSGAARKTYGRFFNSATMLSAGRYIPAERLFAGGCNGDSGGPLTSKVGSKTVLVGLTSWGSAQGCDKGKPTIFTKLTYYVSDLSRGIKLVEKSAQKYNRALPRNISKAQITGDPRVGNMLTCNQGEWTENTSEIQITWVSPNRLEGSTSPIVKVEDGDGGADFACEVRGVSAAGELVVSARVTIPEAPRVAKKPTIAGVVSTDVPKVGQSAVCNSPAWATTVEQESKKYWFVSSEYNTEAGPVSATELGVGNSLTLTKEIILALHGKFLYCRVQALNAGGITSTWGWVQVPRISQPYPSVRINGYSSAAPPKINTEISCALEKASQFETVKYSWRLSERGSGESRALTSTSEKLTLTRELIIEAKGKSIYCDVEVTNLIGEGKDSAGIYIVAPQLPSSPETAITGLDPNNIVGGASVATCETRKLIDDELITYLWGYGDAQDSNSIKNTIGFSKIIPITSQMMDELPGLRLLCKATIENLAGKTDSTAPFSVPVPEVQFFSKTGRYYKYVPSTVSWIEARRLALASTYNGMQGYLATPNSKEENDFLVKKSSRANIWIGATDVVQEGCWRFSDGPEANTILYSLPSTANCAAKPGAFANFGVGEPNNNPGFQDGYQNVALMRGDGTWDDGLTSDYFGYVIEYGGSVVTMDGAPGGAVVPNVTLTAPVDGVVTRGLITILGKVDLERFNNTRPAALGIRISGASNPTYTPTLNFQSVTRTVGGTWQLGATSENSQFMWNTTSRNFSITFDASSFVDGDYVVTIFSREPNGQSGKASFTMRVPQVARNVVASAVGDSTSRVYLTWDAPSNTAGITDYQISYQTSGGEWQTVTKPASLVTNFTVTTLSPATVYQFRVIPVINNQTNLESATLSNVVATSSAAALSLDTISNLTNWSIVKEISGVWNPATLKPLIRLEAKNYDSTSKTWIDSSGNNRHIASAQVTGAPVVKSITATNGVTKTFDVVAGGVRDGIKLGNPDLGSYTFITVARYSGTNQKRIFTGQTGNHVIGWWSGKTGLAYHEAWVTELTSGDNNNWFMITDASNTFRVNGTIKGSARNSGLPQMTINWGNVTYGTETSDWEVAEILIFDRNLSLAELSLVEDYIGGTYGVAAYNVGASYAALAPKVENSKLRIITTDGGRASALNPTKFDSTRGIDIRYRFNLSKLPSGTAGDGFTLFLADAGNADIAAAISGGTTWAGTGAGASLAYQGNNPSEQLKGGLLGVQFLHNGNPKVQVLGRTGINSQVPILRSANVGAAMGQDLFMRVLVDPLGLPNRSYKVWLSTTNIFTSVPTLSGLLAETGLNWVDSNSGIQFGFTGATGGNVMNVDIDKLSINGVLK